MGIIQLVFNNKLARCEEMWRDPWINTYLGIHIYLLRISIFLSIEASCSFQAETCSWNVSQTWARSCKLWILLSILANVDAVEVILGSSDVRNRVFHFSHWSEKYCFKNTKMKVNFEQVMYFIYFIWNKMHFSLEHIYVKHISVVV